MLWADFVQTVVRSVVPGYLIGCGAGFLVALGLDRSRFLMRGVMPVAGVFGALPIVVMGLVWLTSPAYIALLWTEPLGRVMIACCGCWMFIGVMVMRKMINFDF